ncbi:MAG: OmpA family protein [Marinibacterium sp.]
MNRTTIPLLAAVAAALFSLTTPVRAQSGADSLARAFDQQIEFKQGSAGCPAGQKCRGITTPTAVRPVARGLAVIPGKVGDDTDLADSLGNPGTSGEVAMMVDYFAVPEDMQINLRIAFDFDSAELRTDQEPKLVDMCLAMRTSPVHQFHIIGHTDAVGSESYNMNLSLLRAEAVRRYLVNDCGIATDRLRSVGLGESVLLRPEQPRADVNRRVEFQALG